MKKILALICVLTSLSAFAQEERHGIGLTIAYYGNIPQAPLGFMIHQRISDKWGIAADFKLVSGNDPKGTDYTGTRSIQEADRVDGFSGNYTYSGGTYDIGPSYRIAKGLYVMALIGYGGKPAYRQYFDNNYILSSDGNYYIKDDSKSISGVNFGASIMYIAPFGLSLHAGAETFYSGVNVGIGYSF